MVTVLVAIINHTHKVPTADLVVQDVKAALDPAVKGVLVDVRQPVQDVAVDVHLDAEVVLHVLWDVMGQQR